MMAIREERGEMRSESRLKGGDTLYGNTRRGEGKGKHKINERARLKKRNKDSTG
jgi:hypothetical protein